MIMVSNHCFFIIVFDYNQVLNYLQNFVFSRLPWLNALFKSYMQGFNFTWFSNTPMSLWTDTKDLQKLALCTALPLTFVFGLVQLSMRQWIITYFLHLMKLNNHIICLILIIEVRYFLDNSNIMNYFCNSSNLA